MTMQPTLFNQFAYDLPAHVRSFIDSFGRVTSMVTGEIFCNCEAAK